MGKLSAPGMVMDAKASASSSPPGLHDAEKRPKSTMARVIVAVVVVVVVLALALGLGLGLGLKHSKSHSPSSTSSPGNGTNSTNPSADALASLAVPPWRQNTEDYTLDFTDWDLNAPPTTREYHWTFTEVELAPDGRTGILPPPTQTDHDRCESHHDGH